MFSTLFESRRVLSLSERLPRMDSPFGFTGQQTETQMMQKVMAGMSLSL